MESINFIRNIVFIKCVSTYWQNYFLKRSLIWVHPVYFKNKTVYTNTNQIIKLVYFELEFTFKNETVESSRFKDCLFDWADILSKTLFFFTDKLRLWLCSFFLKANLRYVGILNMFININPMTKAKALISIAKPEMFIRTIKITYNIPNAIEMMQALRGISRVFFFFLLIAISFGLGLIQSFKLLRLLWMWKAVDASMVAPTKSATKVGKPKTNDIFWISNLNELSPCSFKHT